MKQTHRSFITPAHLSLAAACAFVLGATAAFAQSTGASSSPSGTSTNTDRYGAGSGSSTSTRKNEANTSDTYSNSTTGASTTSSPSTYGSSNPGSSGTYSSDTTSMTGRSSDKLSWSDRRFVTKAADDGNDEIALAKLATERASNPEVKSFAQKLVDDHTQVASELSSIASSKNVKIDKDNDHDRAYKRLSKKSGTDFDREFVEHMVDEHEKDIKMFEKAAKNAKDADVRSFAAKHVDHLRQHLQSAENLRQTIMPTGRMNDNSGRSSSSTGTSGSSGTSSSQYGTSASSSTTPSSSSSTAPSSESSFSQDKTKSTP